MQWFLVFFYSVIFCFCISKIKIIRKSDVKIQWWIAIFLTKVLVGIIYGNIHSQSYGGGDTLYGFKQGIRVYHTLFDYGIFTYLKLVFLPCHYPIYSGLEKWANNSIPYGDESYYLIIRFHALVALISGSYYNVHVVFYNILSFSGVFLIYSAFKDELKEKKYLLIVALILIPSIVFWTSGIHKDGLALLGIAMIYYSVKNTSEFSKSNLFILVFGTLILYIVRSYLIAILIPILFVYLVFKKVERRLILYYLFGFTGFSLIIILISSLMSAISPLDKLIWWQLAFNNLPSTENSVAVPVLLPNLISLVKIIPVSFYHAFLNPLPWQAINIYQLIIGLQDLLLFIVLVFLILYTIFKRRQFPHLFYLSIGYTMSLYILLGIIVPNLGALSRYKSTGTFFLCLAIISLIPIESVRKIYKYYNKKYI